MTIFSKPNEPFVKAGQHFKFHSVAAPNSCFRWHQILMRIHKPEVGRSGAYTIRYMLDENEFLSIDPAHEALVADSVGLALLVVLEALGPAERLAFVLHDMFAVPFGRSLSS